MHFFLDKSQERSVQAWSAVPCVRRSCLGAGAPQGTRPSWDGGVSPRGVEGAAVRHSQASGVAPVTTQARPWGVCLGFWLP